MRRVDLLQAILASCLLLIGFLPNAASVQVRAALGADKRPLGLTNQQAVNDPPLPPLPGDLPDEVERAHARQAIEDALRKLLEHGEEFHVAHPPEIVVEGEWGYGIVEVQTSDETVATPLTILVRRLPNGDWQALTPRDSELYFQWLDLVPDLLIPMKEREAFRSRVAEFSEVGQHQTRSFAQLAVSTSTHSPVSTVLTDTNVSQHKATVFALPPDAIQPITGANSYLPIIGVSRMVTQQAWIEANEQGYPSLLMSDEKFVSGLPRGQHDIENFLSSIDSALLSVDLSVVDGYTTSAASMLAFLGEQAGVSPSVLLTLLENRFSVLSTSVSQDWSEEELLYMSRWATEAAGRLFEGFYTYYGGIATQEIELANSDSINLNAGNAATYALRSFFAIDARDRGTWEDTRRSQEAEFADTYISYFGDPIEGYLNAAHPPETELAELDGSLSLPSLKLPWTGGDTWWYTGGPHNFDGSGDYPLSGVDYQPIGYSGCSPAVAADRWIVASAGGKTVDYQENWLKLDHDRDGNVSTGWLTVYGHIANRIGNNIDVQQGQQLGNPSCYGGIANGVHQHFGIKYQNVWQPIDGTSLSGWVIGNGARTYHGYMRKDGQTKESCLRSDGSFRCGEDSKLTSDNNGGGSDTTPPTGGITSPNEGAVISDRSVRVEGWGSDDQSGFDHAHFTANYAGSWRQIGPDFTSSPFGFNWNLCDAGVPDGPVEIGLDIWDRAGNQANSPGGVRHITKNFNCSPPPPSCNNNADQIALFDDPHRNNNGSCVTLNIGDYPNPGALGGLGNDVASSVRVGGNVLAVLCEHDNYQGRCETFSGDDGDLSDNGLNNAVSSARVQQRSQTPPAPALQSPGNGAAINENANINLVWSATGDQYYGEVWGGPAGTLTFGWQSGVSKDLGAQWAGYVYSWRVKARNGAGESGWSDAWTFTVKLATPTNLTAQAASRTQVNLSWSDNSGNEEGYQIYRNGSFLTEVGINSNAYQDTNASCNTTYAYQVRAYRGGVQSDMSNTAIATTPICEAPRPDLVPSRWPGWEYPITPSSVRDTFTLNTLYAGRLTYVDWGVTNAGNAPTNANTFGDFYIDDALIAHALLSSNVEPGVTWAFLDWSETIYGHGEHILKFVADPDNLIAESNESNNVWEQTFTWQPVLGWWGEYYNTLDLSGNPVLVRDDPEINFEWQNDTPDPVVSGDFSARWTRDVSFGAATYRFSATHDDGMRIWIDDELRLDQWDTCCRTDTIDIPLAAGVHPIRVEMRDTNGWATAKVSWTCADDTNEPNNAPAYATAIAYGQTLHSKICPTGDQDYYAFTGATGDRVVIDIDAQIANSLLDAYLVLYDSDGSTVLAIDDDEYSGRLDSHLGYQLPHAGIYYLKVREFSHPYEGGADYFYSIRLIRDHADPRLAEFIAPRSGDWLDSDRVTIAASASDDQSGVERVEFLWHDSNWGASEWVWLGADRDGSDGWNWEFPTNYLPDQVGSAFYLWAFDWANNWTGAAAWGLGIDRILPSSAVTTLPAISPSRFIVNWSGSDSLSGVRAYDVQYRDGTNGVWANWVLDASITSREFTGIAGHTYFFRSRAVDHANHWEEWPTNNQGDASTTIELPTATPTHTPTRTPTRTYTPPPTPSKTLTPTNTPTPTSSNTPTPTPSNTSTRAPTFTPTQPAIATSTSTPTATDVVIAPNPDLSIISVYLPIVTR